ncbi:MAG: hypothetical protein L3J45_04520 [Flavobacteriaceae bacterium]|nr:hypothetical protein [Flavobacteriaceae bacterium]
MHSKWRPSGTIKVWDDIVNNYVGVEGVEVRARRWFTTHRGIANASGSYSCDGTFRRHANYSIDWERYNFALQDGWLNGATYNGPKKRGNWDLNLKDDKQEYYATIFRAAHHYYYKDIKGLRRPPQNSFWKPKLRIRAYYKANSDLSGQHKASRRYLGLGSAIKIYNPQANTEDVYATVIHELAHASHWNMDKSNYNTMNDCADTFLGLSCSGDAIIAESWARGVEWELTRMVYTGYKPDYSRLRYTGVVQDMIDGIKTRFSDYYWTKNNSWVPLSRNYSDRVSGYTIRQIEDALIGQKKWNDWKNNIKNKYNNGTENNLHETFNYWNAK